MNAKTDKVVNRLFLLALGVCVVGLTVNVAVSGNDTAEAIYEPTTLAATAETTEYITEPTQAETEATEPAMPLYDVPLDECLQLHIIHEAEKYGIDPAIIMAMAYRESGYNPKAIGDGGDSYGLLQVQPYWHYGRMQELGCTDLLDPYQNVTVAVDYLAEMLDWYDGDMAKALTAYNRGHYSGTITSYAKTVMAMAEELELV